MKHSNQQPLSRAVFLAALGVSSLSATALELSYIAALPGQCRDGCILHMADRSSGWLESRSEMWTTNDGGRHWLNVRLPATVTPGEHLKAGFSDQFRAWVMLGAPSVLFETVNAGHSWTAKTLPKFDGIVNDGWLSIDQNIGWIAGAIYKPSSTADAPNYALERLDSGGWKVLNPVVFSTSGANGWEPHELPSCCWIVDRIHFLDESHGFAIGDGCLYFTDTGGRTWSTSSFKVDSRSYAAYPDDGQHPTVYFLDHSNGWLSLDERHQSLYRTKDGGKNWIRITRKDGLYFEPRGYAATMHFLDLNHGIGIVRNSELVESLDGGATWTTVKTTFLPRTLYFINKQTGWVLSDDAIYELSLGTSK